MSRSESGFTLLEVLAAVALLGILYTVLAGVAIQGLRAEGIARRKLEASLLADERLAGLELQIEEGNVPVEGVEEEEFDIFMVRTSVEPFEIPLPLPEDGAAPLGSILSPDALSGGAAPVRRIELRVSWLEGEGEYSVVRTTFGFDLLSLADRLPVDSGAPQGAGGGEDQLRLDGGGS